MNSTSFQNALNGDDFLVTVELLTTRTDGLENFHRFVDDYQSHHNVRTSPPAPLLEERGEDSPFPKGKGAGGLGGGSASKPGVAKIVAITAPHSPGGVPTLDPYTALSAVAPNLPPELDAIAHVSCKDLNRNGLEAHLRNLRSIGVRNLLALTGDLPVDSKPVFELDSLGLLRLIIDVNAQTIAQTDPEQLDSMFQFYPGAGMNPYKYTLASAWQQYAKMVKKIASGAEFLMTQVGHDTIKASELIRYLRAHDLNIPVFGNVFLLTKPAVTRMAEGKLPGTYASETLLEKITTEWGTKAKGEAAMLERCAQQTAFFRELGFKGVHIGGMGLTFSHVTHIMERAQEIYEHQEPEAYQANIHFPSPDAQYFIDLEGEFVLPDTPPKPSFKQRVMGFAHDHLVNPDSLAGKLVIGKNVPGAPDERKGLRQAVVSGVERLTKGLLVQCQNCGDCLLPEQYYAICNESACTKGLPNAPCGDSNAVTGMCGNDDETVCAGELVFYAAFAVGKLGELSQRINSPKIAELRHTSAVMNYFAGIDHRSRIAGKVRQKKPINLIEIGESIHAQIPRIYWTMNDLLQRGVGQAASLSETGKAARSTVGQGGTRMNGSLAYLTDVITRQIAVGADYIAINVDAFPQQVRPGLMQKYVAFVNSLSEDMGGIPVCIDSSDPVTKSAGLEAYYRTAKAPEAKLPIVNSINIIHPQPVLELKAEYDFKVIAMLHDRIDASGNPVNVNTVDEVHELARQLYEILIATGFTPDDIFFDAAVVPIATDIEATHTHKVMHSIQRIMSDPYMKGVHTAMGLSNCSHMMPNRLAINRGYLQIAMEHGLDAAVLDPTIDYGIKDPGKQILSIIKDLAENDGTDMMKSFAIFERIAEYSRKYGKNRET